jgi:hypothetical protein
MAKRQVSKKTVAEEVETENTQGRPTGFVNSAGIWVSCLGVEPRYIKQIRERVRREFESRGELPVKPTYTVEMLGGGTKVIDHDEKSILSASDEEKEAWGIYVKREARLNNEMTERLIKALIIRGIDCQVPTDWIAEQKLLGFVVPDDPLQLKLDYCQSELILKAEDVDQLMTLPLFLSFKGLSNKEFEDLEDQFRRLMESVGDGPGETPIEPEPAEVTE